MRTRLLRPSGGWYSAVGVASMAMAGLGRRGAASDSVPIHAMKPRRSVMWA
jgi:hypothetical protein